MPKRSILRFVQLLFCWVFALSFLVGCGSYEVVSSGSYFPSSAKLEVDRVQQALPPKLRAEVKEILARSCKVEEKKRPDPSLLGQTQEDPLWELEKRLFIPVLKFAIAKATEPTPGDNAANLGVRQILPIPPVVVEKVPVEDPPLLERDGVQFGLGLAHGGASSFVPLASNAVDVAIELKVTKEGTYWARAGRACGEIVIGTGQLIVGGAGMSAGVGMCSTGGGAVPGVIVFSESMAIAANGCAAVVNGVRHGLEVVREDPPEEPAVRYNIRLKDPKPKAASEPSVAAAPPAAKPATQPPVPEAPPPGVTTVRTSPSGSTTSTRRRLAPGEEPPETTTTIHMDETGRVTSTTTTRTKPAPSGQASQPMATTNGHHPWPKYLGGPAKQDLAKLPEPLHKSYHSGLDKILPRQRGTAYYDNLNPQGKQQLIRDLAAYTKAFDAKYGTRLYDSMIRNGFPDPG